ncbi:MAG: F0F1 ATP synthase subunit A [Patescibacteria group bacterium]|nr:F0F1 ATP synthase subunit A [Patescibacteria group bacterium]
MENNSTQLNIQQPTHEVTIFAEPIFNVGGLQITNSLLTSWLALLVIVAISLAIRLKIQKIPNKLQNIFELVLEGAMGLVDQVTNDRKITDKIFPIVFSLFMFILVNNWLGLLPFVGSVGFNVLEEGHTVFVPLFRSGTADINMTLALSIMIVIASNIFGILTIGVWKIFNKYVNLKALGDIFTKVKHDKSIVIVSPISFFVGVLELLGEFAKVASLSFRLFGNVFAGEVLLASMGAIFLYVLPGPFLFLEVFVGLIQALIFSLLASVYFTIAAQDHSEHEEEHSEKQLASV